MNTYIYDRVQYGWWGKTVVKTIKVRAKTQSDAELKVGSRKDNGKKLRNGDRITYTFNRTE